mgnify:CR=1 FL=1
MSSQLVRPVEEVNSLKMECLVASVYIFEYIVSCVFAVSIVLSSCAQIALLTTSTFSPSFDVAPPIACTLASINQLRLLREHELRGNGGNDNVLDVANKICALVELQMIKGTCFVNILDLFILVELVIWLIIVNFRALALFVYVMEVS